jgi:hypothetical protein
MIRQIIGGICVAAARRGVLIGCRVEANGMAAGERAGKLPPA